MERQHDGLKMLEIFTALMEIDFFFFHYRMERLNTDICHRDTGHIPVWKAPAASLPAPCNAHGDVKERQVSNSPHPPELPPSRRICLFDYYKHISQYLFQTPTLLRHIPYFLQVLEATDIISICGPLYRILSIG